MSRSLRIDPDSVRALTDGLAAVAEQARQDLSDLEHALARRGEPWGDDEPGRTIGESYTPQAEIALEGYQNLVDNLRELSKGVVGAADDIGRRDRLGGDLVRELGRDRIAPAAPVSGETHTPRQGVDVGATSYPGDTGSIIEGTPGTPQPATPGSWTTQVIPGPGSQFAGDGSVGKPPAVGPQSAGTDPSASAGHRDADGTPSAPTAIASPSGTPGPIAPGTVVSRSRAPRAAAGPEVRPTRTTGPVPTGSTPADRSSTTVGRPAGTPWSRGLGGSVVPPNPAIGAPSPRPAATGGRPGRVFGPELAGPAPTQDRPVRNIPDDSKSRRKAADPERKRPPIPTDPLALEAARAMAERHGIQLAGFETSGIGVRTVGEMARALDDILGKYPFLGIGGIEIGDLDGRRISRVRWDRIADEPERDRNGRPWVLFDRTFVANPAGAAAQQRAASRTGEMGDASAERPMYSVVVGDLGHVLETLAGPYPRRTAQRALITEYHRISGPWAGRDSLARVVDGYRRWRDQLPNRSDVGGRFEPRTALVAAFTEVELRGTAACRPAKVLHLLLVENTRERSDAR